jgi:hypothetical protein
MAQQSQKTCDRHTTQSDDKKRPDRTAHDRLMCVWHSARIELFRRHWRLSSLESVTRSVKRSRHNLPRATVERQQRLHRVRRTACDQTWPASSDPDYDIACIRLPGRRGIHDRFATVHHRFGTGCTRPSPGPSGLTSSRADPLVLDQSPRWTLLASAQRSR